MNDVAIIIDCWETWYSEYQISVSNDYLMFSDIKKFIELSPNIQTIILASYNCIDIPNKIWHKNSIDLIGQEDFDSKDLISHCAYNEYQTTDDMFLSWESDRYQISMHFTWELEKLLKIRPIGNIYLCGQSTDECVRVRPLGWESLYRFIKQHNLDSKILLHRYCVNDNIGKTFTLKNNPGWAPTDNPDIFEYIGIKD